MSSRDPFPSPKYEDDLTLSGFRPQQRKPYNKPTHLAHMEEPWSRLHDAATFASARRNCSHQVSGDSLDFQLKSVYDHHKDNFWCKNQVLFQKETITAENRKLESLKQEEAHKEEERTRVWVDPQRRSIHSIK